MRFYNIMPFLPFDVEKMAEEYRRYSKATGMKLLLCSMTLHPEGDDPYVKADRFAAAFGELKNLLKDTDIRLGVLIQAFIGHGWSSSSPSVTLFQPTINHTGKTRGRMCPLDENFLKYCDHVITSLAKHAPATFLLDDDTRLLDNDMVECFCPLHRARFSKPYSQEELIELVTHAGPHDPIMKEFEKIRRDSLEAFCARIRKAIDSVDPAIPCGVSGPGREHLMLERMALAAAGPNTEPFIRLGNALYGRVSALRLPACMYRSELLKKACGTVKFLLDESDTFPQNRYSQSCAGLHSHLTSAIVSGLRGSKTWIENFLNPAVGRHNAEFESMMKEYSGFYKELVNAVEGIRWKGPSTPLVNLEKNFTPLEYPDYFTAPDWFSSCIGFLGIPSDFREPGDPDAECFMISGDMVKHFTDDELEKIVRKNMFLDSAAAEKFIERGFGEYLGVKLGKCPHFSAEIDRSSGLRMRNLFNGNTKLLIPEPGAEPLSDLVKPDGAGKMRFIAPGTTGFRNRNGKAVFVWCSVIPSEIYCVDPPRKIWLENIFRRVAEIPVTCPEEQDILLRCGIAADGKLLTVLFDLSYDAMKEIPLVCGKEPVKIQVLSPSGEWRETPFRRENGKIIVETACPPYHPVVMKLS